MVSVAHVYMTQEMFSKPIVSGGCLAAGTKIIMYDGTFKNIENIVIGDMVKTMEGPKLVTNTWNPETLEFGNPPSYEIEFEDGLKIICSNQHPFLRDNKWVDAEDLSVGDDVTHTT
jgi:intein/homing endonuclease